MFRNQNFKKAAPRILIPIIVVALFGAMLLRFLDAASPGVHFEAESTADPLHIRADGSASGGQFVEFQQQNTNPLVIYDTDMGPDIDDAVALAILHEYESLGMIELAAVTISRGSTNGARYTDAVNTYYGRPNIPIGIYRGGTVSSDIANVDRYTTLASNWPHDVHQSTIPDGYKLQRQILAQAESQGRDVIMIQTGFSGNLSQLMNSGGDSFSPKNGITLTNDNVSLLAIMAGNLTANSAEFNIEKDLSSARNLFNKWPVTLVMSDWNVGGNLLYPYFAGIRDNLHSNHPVRRAYENETLSWHRSIDPNPPPVFYNMASWDLTSVVDGIEPGDYFSRTGPGTVTVNSQGVTRFSSGSGQHYILDRVPSSQKQRVINRMIDLVE